MKPLDLIRLYDEFTNAMASTSIPNDLKLKVAHEVLNSLPPDAFCAAAPATRELVGKGIQGVIDNLQNDHDQRTKAKGTAEAEAPTVRPRKARQESLGK